MIGANLPALQVVLPLIAAPICVILRNAKAAWALTLAASWATFAISIALLLQVLEGGTISYHLGNWVPPLGIEYRVDVLGAFVLVIVSAIGALTLSYARKSVEAEIPEERIYLFYCMFLLCLAGLLGIAITGDVFNLFVFLEISSLSSYVLISLGSHRRALTASYRYLIMGTIGATFYIIGVGMLYMMTGTLNMVDIAERVVAVSETRTVLAALAFLVVGISLKLALFPLHLWLPNAYTYAPSVVTAFLAATATKVAVYALIRITFTVFGAVDIAQVTPLSEILLGLAVLSMFVASLVAIFQTNIKRMLAYSSIAQIGYMVLGISLLSAAGLAGGIIHLFNHALMKCLLFLALGCVVLRCGSTRIEDLEGLGKRMPFTAAAFTVGGLSLIGLPLTTGFVSKWALVEATLDKGWWPLAVLILITSMLAVVYVWRVVEAIYMRPARTGAAEVTEAPLSMLLPMAVLAAVNIYFGINGADTLGIANEAARLLIGGTP